MEVEFSKSSQDEPHLNLTITLRFNQVSFISINLPEAAPGFCNLSSASVYHVTKNLHTIFSPPRVLNSYILERSVSCLKKLDHVVRTWPAGTYKGTIALDSMESVTTYSEKASHCILKTRDIVSSNAF